MFEKRKRPALCWKGKKWPAMKGALVGGTEGEGRSRIVCKGGKRWDRLPKKKERFSQGRIKQPILTDCMMKGENSTSCIGRKRAQRGGGGYIFPGKCTSGSRGEGNFEKLVEGGSRRCCGKPIYHRTILGNGGTAKEAENLWYLNCLQAGKKKSCFRGRQTEKES